MSFGRGPKIPPGLRIEKTLRLLSSPALHENTISQLTAALEEIRAMGVPLSAHIWEDGNGWWVRWWDNTP